jgi:L-threonylcarbamoyladenylate synthase
MLRIAVPDEQALLDAVIALQQGELVAFPTETVYGLGADASNPDAVRRIFEAKGRPADHPVIVHLKDAAQMSAWARTVPDAAKRLTDAFWPGPLTLILPRSDHVADVVTGGQDSVGLRVPAHPVAKALLDQFGGGIAAPSANRFGHVSPTRASHVADDLGDAVAMILDGGPCDLGIESTIVAFTSDEPVLLRPGAIGVAALTRVLGRAPATASGAAPRASGTLPAHYAPRTPSQLLSADLLRAELVQLGERDESIAVLARTTTQPDEFDGVWIDAPRDPAQYAHELYANLRKLDQAVADAMLIEDVPQTPEWMAIRDRLVRATQGQEDDID